MENKKTRKSILVTGGAGYIGSHCVQKLIEAGHKVVILDNLSTGFEQLVLSDTFIQGDINDKALVTEALKTHQIDAVMHFAAHAYVGESVSNPQKYYDNNVTGTLNLLSAMREAGVNTIIFSSSCATFGHPEEIPIHENLPTNPINPYGFTKRVIDEVLKDFNHAYGLQYVSLKYFNAAGADPSGRLGECHEPETHLIPLVLQTASGKRDNITIFGTDYDTPDGTCIRDYIHIHDIADAHLLSLEYLNNGGESGIFNLGTETGYSVREIIEACEKVTGKKINIIEGDRREGDPAYLVASAKKIKSAMNWQPRYTNLEEIIETAWQWEQKH